MSTNEVHVCIGREPFVHICGKRYVDRVEETTKVTDLENLFGAFLYPNILSKSQIVSEEKDNIKYIEVGDSLTIPIVFEYFTTANKPSITKSLFFDIKHSTVADVKHFLIEVTGNYDFTTSSEVYKDVDFDIVS